MPPSPAESNYSAEAGELGTIAFDRPLRELVNRPAVRCLPQATLREALETLHRERVGSIVVVDRDERPVGIFTLGDVVVRVALAQAALDTPIEALMSRDIVSVAADKPAFEAALIMARRNIRHVPLVEAGRLAGVVSESRLFALWRRGIGAIRAGVVEAGNVEDVVLAAAGIRDLPGKLLHAGLTADAVTALLTSLNDMIVGRLLELTGAGAALRQMGGCWLALGSQGRAEQTLASDQDNGVLFDDASDPQRRRDAFLPLARQVNQALDRCGFALCRGGIMASNPAWCLSLQEWRARFASWIDRPDQAALLNASIFFDFRPIDGPHPLAGELHAWLAGHVRDKGLFLTLMTLNALNNSPPLGLVRSFSLLRGGAHPRTIDLKSNGIQLFVEAARIYALSSGVTATHSVERLEASVRARGMPQQEAAAWCDAFRAIQRRRLRLNTEQLAAGTVVHNFLDPYALNTLDRNILKEALGQARSLQSRLSRDFAMGAP